MLSFKYPIMRSQKSLFWFLLLNVVVSITATLTAIWIWEQYKQNNSDGTVVQSISPEEQSEIPIVRELPPTDHQVVHIENVFGAGDIVNEAVLIRVTGISTLWLEDWVISDTAENSYTFPALKLNDGGAINLYTKAGSNSAIALFWGMQKPVWQVGETITITDYEGNLRAEYVIP